MVRPASTKKKSDTDLVERRKSVANAWPTGLTAYVFPASPAGNTMYKVFNADINGAGVTRFSDEDLSTQTNCRWYGIVHNLSDAPSTLQ